MMMMRVITVVEMPLMIQLKIRIIKMTTTTIS